MPRSYLFPAVLLLSCYLFLPVFPEVPDNYTQLGRGECLRILAQIRNWMQDRSCRGATKNWTLPQIREYIGNYVRVVKLQNASLSLEDDTKSEE